jgi:hypothetical protein
VFKIKIEQDFFSDDDDPLLSAKPLYYQPEKNTLFIREHSSHNSRFLYEILRIALTPPVIAIHSHADKTIAEMPQNPHDFRQVRNRIHTVFPYIKLCNSMDEHCPQHLVPDYCPPLQCYIQSRDNTPFVYLEDNSKKVFSLHQQKETIDFLWHINALLEQKGCLSFYNDYDEIVRRYC